MKTSIKKAAIASFLRVGRKDLANAVAAIQVTAQKGIVEAIDEINDGLGTTELAFKSLQRLLDEVGTKDAKTWSKKAASLEKKISKLYVDLYEQGFFDAMKNIGAENDDLDKWGFDLTDFGSDTAFKKVLKVAGAQPKGKKVKKKLGNIGFHIYWEWKGKGVTIQTNANPLTGEDSYGGKRELGYASYIGVEGDPPMVRKVADAIKKNAEYIKEESPGSFI